MEIKDTTNCEVTFLAYHHKETVITVGMINNYRIIKFVDYRIVKFVAYDESVYMQHGSVYPCVRVCCVFDSVEVHVAQNFFLLNGLFIFFHHRKQYYFLV